MDRLSRSCEESCTLTRLSPASRPPGRGRGPRRVSARRHAGRGGDPTKRQYFSRRPKSPEGRQRSRRNTDAHPLSPGRSGRWRGCCGGRAGWAGVRRSLVGRPMPAGDKISGPLTHAPGAHRPGAELAIDDPVAGLPS
eukprot:scaffold3899_cov393-Prasinococcus_capsulatus_cf.AAC.7